MKSKLDYLPLEQVLTGGKKLNLFCWIKYTTGNQETTMSQLVAALEVKFIFNKSTELIKMNGYWFRFIIRGF